MTSIQDTVNAAYRIGEGAKQVTLRSETCASALQQHAQTLAGLVRGSRSGEEAVREVQAAERAVRECGARMLTLQTRVDEYVRDAVK